MAGRSLGMICLALFLILWGVLALTNIRFTGAELIEAILALLAGILILLGR
jgi:hypothetical protein